MNRREFFGLFSAALAALVFPTRHKTIDDLDRSKLYCQPRPQNPLLCQPHMHGLDDPMHDWHGNWPILPVYNGPSRDYTITWHNTGINQWPNIS